MVEAIIQVEDLASNQSIIRIYLQNYGTFLALMPDCIIFVSESSNMLGVIEQDKAIIQAGIFDDLLFDVLDRVVIGDIIAHDYPIIWVILIIDGLQVPPTIFDFLEVSKRRYNANRILLNWLI